MSRMPKTGNEQKSVKPKVRSLLSRYGWFWWDQAASPYGSNGKSDTAALKNGVFLAVESKFGVGKATALQIGYLNSITMEDGFGFVVNEKTIHHLETFLKHFHAAVDMVRRGNQPDAEIGGPMLDAMTVLTDYPKSMEDYAAQKEARRLRAEKGEPETTDDPDMGEDNHED